MREKVRKIIQIIASRTKTDINYLVHGNFWLGLDTLVNIACSFGLVWFFGNFVAAETYGTYKFILSYQSIFAIFALGGFGGATLRAVAKGYEGELLRNHKVQMLGALVSGLGALIFSFYYFYNANPLLGAGFLILAIASPFFEPPLLYDAFLFGKKNFKASFWIGTAVQVFGTLCLIAAILLRVNTVGLLATFFAAFITARYLALFYVVKKFKPNKETSSETSKIGWHFSFLGVLGDVANYLDRIAIFHFLGAVELAIYSFAIAPVEQVKGLFKNTTTLALPRFSERTEEELQKTMVRKMFLMALGVAAFVIPFIILAPWLFKIFLPKYLSAISYSRIYAISLIGVISSLPISAMKSLAKMKNLYFNNIVSSAFLIGLIIVLTPIYGLWGTIMARLIQRVVGIPLALYFFYQK